MRVLIDHEPLTEAPRSISDALVAARLSAERRGRVVIEAILDGQPLPDAVLSDPPSTPATGTELRFITADPAELVAGTLGGVGETLTDLKIDQAAVAELLTLGRMGEAMDRLGQSLRTWEAVQQAVVDGTTLMGLSIQSVRVKTGSGERSVAEQVQALAGCLTEVKRAFKAEDWSALADVLGYDLQEQAEEWKLGLASLARQVREVRTTGRQGQ